MSRLEKYLRMLSEHGASALHVGVDAPPRVRVGGRLVHLDAEGMPLAELEAEIQALTSASTLEGIRRGEPADFPCELGGARYRARCFVRHGGPTLILRATAHLSAFSKLGLPTTVQRLAHLRRGLVLVSGPTGSGKSTTIGALLGELDTGRPKHVVTLESPVELIHVHQRTTISQREVGRHTKSFATGLASAIRQRPDVIFVSDLPDGESVALALEAASAGVLVIATVRASGVVRALERLLDAAPARRQATLHALAEHLSAALSLLRLSQADGAGHVVAVELLVRNRGIVNALRADDLAAIPEIVKEADNMRTMDDALAELVEQKRIALEDAFDHARDKDRFRKHQGARRVMRHTRLE